MDAKLGEIEAAFNGNRSVEQKSEFIKQYFEVKRNINSQHLDANMNITEKNGKLYVHAFGVSMEVNVANPNAMFLNSPEID